MSALSIQEIIRNITLWLPVKIKTEQITSSPRSIKQNQIWWCNIGQNIGTEIYGKGNTFSRPVIIYKKLSKYNFLVIPCSTNIKTGSWYVSFWHQKKQMVAVLSQIRVVDYRRINDFVAELGDADIAKIKEGFCNLYA